MKLYGVKIRSRHPSHDVLRGVFAGFPFRSIVRFGSTTTIKEVYGKELKEPVVEINTVEAVKVSSNKLHMKEKFDEAGISSADWWEVEIGNVFCKSGLESKKCEAKELPYPIVAKHIFGSRGTGNYLLHSEAELNKWLGGKDLSKYIFEKYYSYNKEYRLHVTKDGCFYTCRKMLKEDTPKEKRWFRNDSNSIWIKEDNGLFDRPTSWKLIVDDCVKALKAVGLDFAAFDVRVQSGADKNGVQRWIIIESNSAPSFGEITAEKYHDILPKLIEDKWKSQLENQE